MNDAVALSELCTHLQEFSELEKAELAHRLHDELGGLLTAAKMDLSWLQSRVDQPLIQQRLAQLGNVLDEAMDLKRRVVEELRPSLLDHFGLPTALRAHVEAICRKAGLVCTVTMAPDMETVPKPMAIALFRVAQQGLDNIVRHAHAKKMHIELIDEPHRYVLKLSDNGRGMDLNDPKFRWTHGLAGMRHRVEALGGRFTIDSEPARGTALTIAVPKSDS
jgi:signal transduction histidine kinase